MRQALSDRERGYGKQEIRLDEDALEHIALVANGDARCALNALELAVLTTPMGADGASHITLAIAEESIQEKALPMDETLLLRHAQRLLQIPAGFGQRRGAGVVCPAGLRGSGSPNHCAARSSPTPARTWAWPIPTPCLQAVAAMRALEDIGMPEARLPIGAGHYHRVRKPQVQFRGSGPGQGLCRREERAASSRCPCTCATP